MFKVRKAIITPPLSHNFTSQDFGKRLERDIKKSVNARIEHTTSLTGQTVRL